VAAFRVAARDLETERAKGAEKTATIERIDAELTQANSLAAQLAAARDEADRALAAEREAWLQQKVALQAGRSALEGELAKTRSQLSAAVDLRAQRDSQIAQLRAETEDATRQFELQRTRLVVLEGERQQWDAARLRFEIENRDLQLQLEAGSRRNESLSGRTVLLEGRVDTAEQQVIEMTHWAAPLLDELDQLRRENRSLAAERDAVSRERARLAAQIAASPAARLRALWRRFAGKLKPPFRWSGARLTVRPGTPGDWKPSYHYRAGEQVVQGALVPAEQRNQQDQRAGHTDRDIEQCSLRERLQKARALSRHRAKLDIEEPHTQSRRPGSAQ